MTMNSEFQDVELSADMLSALGSAPKGDIISKSFSIDYTRNLSEYGSAAEIARFVQTHERFTLINVSDLGGVQDSFEDYLGSEHYGSSTIKQMLKTPMHFAFARDDDKLKLDAISQKDYFQLGSFLHEAVLQPWKFNQVLVEPKFSLASKAGVNGLIEFWTQQVKELDNSDEIFQSARDKVAELGLDIEKMDGLKTYYQALKIGTGLIPVSEEHYLKIKILQKHINRYAGGIIGRLIRGSRREVSFYSEDPETGIKVKVRPDAVQFAENIGVNAIISVKSTGCEDLRAFLYRCAELDYDLSEGMYQEVVSDVSGRDFNTTIMIMLQTIEPYAIAVLVWKPEDIEMGKYKYRTALRDIKNCFDTGEFRGFDTYAEDLGLIELPLPSWNNKELDPKTVW